MGNVGHPVTVFTPEYIEEIQEKLTEYIDSKAVPVVCEFAYLNDIRRSALYEIPELAYSLKRLTEKKQANLELGALSNKINVSMAIFSLKQLGWSDKQELTGKGGGPIQINRVAMSSVKVEDLDDADNK